MMSERDRGGSVSGSQQERHDQGKFRKAWLIIIAAVLMGMVVESTGGRFMHSVSCGVAAALDMHISLTCAGAPDEGDFSGISPAHTPVAAGDVHATPPPDTASQRFWRRFSHAALHGDTIVQFVLGTAVALLAGWWITRKSKALLEEFEVIAEHEATSHETDILVIPVSWPHRAAYVPFTDTEFDWLVGLAHGEPDFSASVSGKVIAATEITLADLREPKLRVRRSGKESQPLENCAWQQAIRTLHRHLLPESEKTTLSRIILCLRRAALVRPRASTPLGCRH
jgi:hypothetical protein